MGKAQLPEVAACGLYCRACGIWRRCHDADDNFTAGPDARPGGMTCKGCRSDHLSKYCIDCDLRECADSKGITTCAECPDVPCDRIKAFDQDEVAHHDGVVAQLAHIRDRGSEAWAKAQRQRWSCPNCGEPFAWYTKKCTRCGKDVPGLDERG